MERELILNRLLIKYENSKHLSEPNSSKRRVLLRIKKKDLPEYSYENAETRDSYNNAAQKLENEGIVRIEWVTNRPVIDAIVLNLEQIDKAYQASGRIHPVKSANEYAMLIENALSDIKTTWIRECLSEESKIIRQTLRLPAFCKHSLDYLNDFLTMLICYDGLNRKEISTRAFSVLCFRDSKRFENDFQELFLKIAAKYNPDLSDISAQDDIGTREKLSSLGIYTNTELHQLSGMFNIKMKEGIIDLQAMYPHGIAIPGSSVDDIVSFNPETIQQVVFIENLTNYNEYLHTEIKPTDMVVYHGGFLSPNKQNLFRKLANSITSEIDVYFWGDIDLGGFIMFTRLKKHFPCLLPMRMFADDVIRYARFGLKRDASYMKRLQNALDNNDFPVFTNTIMECIKYGVTIEQEIFLSSVCS